MWAGLQANRARGRVAAYGACAEDGEAVFAGFSGEDRALIPTISRAVTIMVEPLGSRVKSSLGLWRVNLAYRYSSTSVLSEVAEQWRKGRIR